MNDDDGSGDTEGSGIPGSGASVILPNWKVNGTRDLTDFFPVHLDIKDLFEQFDPAAHTYILKNANGALNYVVTDLKPTESGSYLTGENKATATATEIDYVKTMGDAQKYPIGVAGANILQPEVINQIKQGNGVVLVDAYKKTTSPLVMEIYKGTTLVYSSLKLNLSIDGVEQMFRHKNLVEAGDGPPPIRLLNYGAADRLTEPANFPDSETNDKHFVFVHGYNVNGEQARGWNAEMFKRMYWSGSKAKFWGVTWYGWDTQDLSIATLPFTRNFHINVQHALKTAPAFSDFINLPMGGKNVTVAAHSLGNMLVSSAIVEQVAKVENYFLIDAAVPIEAYDGTVGRPSDIMSLGMNNIFDGEVTINNMIHPTWSAYKVGLYASEWYRLFSGNDWRSKLTWRDRFVSLPTLTKTFNFYSSGEDVLDNHLREPYVPDIFTEGSGQYAWALQEKLKGIMPTGWMLGSNYGGWGFNKNDYNEWVIDSDNTTINVVMRPDTANQLFADNPEQFRAKPLFKLTGNDLKLLVSGAEGSDYAKANRDRLLAEVIPVLSRAAGKTSVSKFGRENYYNFDMQEIFKNGWPDIRTKINNDYRWLHSDIRDIAYPFINGLFRDFVERGEL